MALCLWMHWFMYKGSFTGKRRTRTEPGTTGRKTLFGQVLQHCTSFGCLVHLRLLPPQLAGSPDKVSLQYCWRNKVFAKSCHFWNGHMSTRSPDHREAGDCAGLCRKRFAFLWMETVGRLKKWKATGKDGTCRWRNGGWHCLFYYIKGIIYLTWAWIAAQLMSTSDLLILGPLLKWRAAGTGMGSI